LGFMPCLVRSAADGEIEKITLGHPLLDDYLAFVAARARTNTWLAVAYDLKVFFEVVGKEPAAVTAVDVFAFLSAQRAPRRGERVVRLEDGEAGLAARTIARRLSSVRGLYGYLCGRENTGGAATRCRPAWLPADPATSGRNSMTWPTTSGRGGTSRQRMTRCERGAGHRAAAEAVARLVKGTGRDQVF